MQISSTTPEEYLAGLDEEIGEDRAEQMRTMDRRITEAMPGRARVLYDGVFWGGTTQRIIGYGDLVQPRPRGEDVRWFVVGLARTGEDRIGEHQLPTGLGP